MNDQTKTITIKEANSFPEGTPIPRIKGELVKLGERESKEGDYGPYTKQWGIIRDGNDSILFTVWKHENIPQSHIGKILTFRAGSGKKPTLKLESDYKDKSKRTLKATESCHVLTEDEESDDIPMDYPKNKLRDDNRVDIRMTDAEVAEHRKNNAQANVATKKAIPAENVLEARKFLMQCVNMRKLADTAANLAAGELYEKAEVKDIGTSFFMAMEKAGFLSKIPNQLMGKPMGSEEAGASEPEMAPEDIPF